MFNPSADPPRRAPAIRLEGHPFALSKIWSIWVGVMSIERPILWQAPIRLAFSRKDRSEMITPR
jgi:hypothetical protein